MDFEIISSKTTFGKLIRLPLKLIPANQVLPILTGKLIGKKWLVSAGRHGCWLGSYEYENQIIFEKYLKPGQIVFDIGAHAGFLTMLASVLIGESGRVFAFEPLPRNISYLKEHLKLNNLTNVQVIEAAVSKSSGTRFFTQNITGYQGGISQKGNLKVKVVSLDELILNKEIPVPDYIKIDVEGHEKSVLMGAKSTLENYHPTIFLSIHGRSVYQQCHNLLTSLNYKIEILDKYNQDELPKNLDLVAYYST
jgi:FkbM family methyltransferase